MQITQWVFLARLKIKYIEWRNARFQANMTEVTRLCDEALHQSNKPKKPEKLG